jgi:hypothetical protein
MHEKWRFITLIDSKYGFYGIEHEGDTDHDGPDTHAGASHPKHKESHKDLFGWRLRKFPCFLNKFIRTNTLLHFQ